MDVERIRREEFTGGTYRGIECELADGMIALGGGKGTYLVGRQMIDAGKPVLPLDLEVGAYSEDGEGALLLHREMLSRPSEFLPAGHTQTANKIEAMSLRIGGHDAADVVQRVVEVLSLEFDGSLSGRSRSVKRYWSYIKIVGGKFLTAIGLLRAIEFLRHLLF